MQETLQMIIQSSCGMYHYVIECCIILPKSIIKDFQVAGTEIRIKRHDARIWLNVFHYEDRLYNITMLLLQRIEQCQEAVYL